MIGPLDYSLCDRTVTIYRRQEDQIVRQVAEGCYYSWQEVQTVDERGRRKDTKCLLLMPGDTQQVFAGDRVFDGVGPDVSVQEWAAFIPVKVAGLAEISYVQPYYWEGALCHVEAGRK